MRIKFKIEVDITQKLVLRKSSIILLNIKMTDLFSDLIFTSSNGYKSISEAFDAVKQQLLSNIDSLKKHYAIKGE
jgi:hypothetical protein